MPVVFCTSTNTNASDIVARPRIAATTVTRANGLSFSSARPALMSGALRAAAGAAGRSRTKNTSVMTPSTANAKLTMKIGSGAVPRFVISRNVTSGPSSAPTVSIVRCTPNAVPS